MCDPRRNLIDETINYETGEVDTLDEDFDDLEELGCPDHYDLDYVDYPFVYER